MRRKTCAAVFFLSQEYHNHGVTCTNAFGTVTTGVLRVYPNEKPARLVISCHCERCVQKFGAEVSFHRLPTLMNTSQMLRTCSPLRSMPHMLPVDCA